MTQVRTYTRYRTATQTVVRTVTPTGVTSAVPVPPAAAVVEAPASGQQMSAGFNNSAPACVSCRVQVAAAVPSGGMMVPVQAGAPGRASAGGWGVWAGVLVAVGVVGVMD
jgi:hypothetical protein